MKKSWAQKLNSTEMPFVTSTEKVLWGKPVGTKMLISSPLEIKDYISKIPKGKFVDPKEMRADLAKKHGADVACPLTTGIFLRIVSEAALEDYALTGSIENITPFWRVVSDNSPLAKKLSIPLEKLQELRVRGG
jgi:hypothetical protein